MAKIVWILFLICSFSILAAQVPSSVRNQSLAGIIDGEWEDIYDPIALSFYQQNYYFTNLSDFVQRVYIYSDSLSMTQESEFLSEYPFGFSFSNPWIKRAKHSFLIRFKDNQMPALSDDAGESTDYSTYYYDTDYDGMYDYRNYNEYGQKNYDDVDSRILLLLNTSLPGKERTFGFRIVYDHNKTASDQALMNYYASISSGDFQNVYSGQHGWYEHESTTYLMTNALTYSKNEAGDFCTTQQSSKLALLLSMMTPVTFMSRDAELRYDLNLEYMDTNHTKTHDNYSGDVYNYYNGNQFVNGEFDNDYTWESNNPSTELFLGARLRRNLNNNSLRYQQGFTEIGFGLGGIYGSINHHDQQLETNSYASGNELIPETIDNLNRYYLEDVKEEGSSLGFKTQIFLKANIPFSNNICFAYGLNAVWKSLHNKMDTDMTQLSKNYTFEGLAFDESSDLLRTTRFGYTGKYESVENTLITTLPVALEFSLPKDALSQNDSFSLRNFSFRLGTVFTHRDSFSDRRYDNTGIEITNTIIENGLGEFVSETNSSDNELNSSQLVNEEHSGSKIYSAGLGYQHSQYLNIDVGGWINSDGEEFYLGAMFTLKR